ncbi:MAG: FAD:protein FMN transferase [Bacteroidota bacterium]
MVRFSFLLLLSLVLFTGCTNDTPALPVDSLIQYSGQTMGTTYNITAVASHDVTTAPKKLKLLTDGWLIKVNESLSTYIDTSIISRINASSDTSVWHPVDVHFVTVFERAKAIHTSTAGAFNPALGPLITAWGFGADAPSTLTQQEVDALLRLTDFDAFILKDSTLKKLNPGAQVDFSAIAKGYGVDVVAALLERHNIKSYFVEIGGEVRTKGQHPENRPWRAGIDKPSFEQSEVRELQAAITLGNQALATSGNYRNFYVRDGQKYVHTINPETGYPEESDLLSVSVIGPDCMTADAYATAFMVMGKDKAHQMAEAQADIEAYFITADGKGGFEEATTAGFPEAQSLQDVSRSGTVE